MRKEEKQKAREKGKDIPAECRVPESSNIDKKAFFNEQCKEVEDNNRRRKTRDLVKKVGDIKGTYHTRMGTIKDKNSKDLQRQKRFRRGD